MRLFSRGFRFRLTFEEARETRPHHMDVVNPRKMETRVLIVGLTLVTLSRRPIRHGVDSRPRINHNELGCIRIRLLNAHDEILVLHAPGTESRQRLAAPAEGGLEGDTNCTMLYVCI